MPQEAIETLNKALARVPGIDNRIVEKQSAEKMQQGKRRLALLAADVEEAIAILGGESGETDPSNDGSWEVTFENLPGGSIKNDAIRNKTFSDPSWMKQADKDYVDCIFTKEATHSDELAKNIRLFNPTFKDIRPWSPGGSNASFCFYINLGKKGELRHGFVIYGGKVIGLKCTEFMETKAFDPWIINLDFTESPEIERGIRIRHGAYAHINGCKGLKRVTMRGHHHACVNCPDTIVDYLSGNLPGQYKDWIKIRPPGSTAVSKYQRAEFCYAEGVKDTNVGVSAQTDTPKKAHRCMAPSKQKYKLLIQEEFQERDISSMDELEKIK